MASAKNLPLARDRALREGFYQVADPGASGTLDFNLADLAIFNIVTAAAESRALPASGAHPVGAMLLVVFKTDGGDLTITGSDQTIVLTNAGECVLFVVSDNNGTLAWRVAGDSRVAFTDFSQGAQSVAINPTDFRRFDAFASPLPTGTSFGAGVDDLHIQQPTVGTTGVALLAGADATQSLSLEATAVVVVPHNYQAGSALSIVIPWTRSNAAEVSATLDLVVTRNADPTVDLVTTAAQDINSAASGTATFVLTPDDIVPGEMLLVRPVAAVNDTGGTGAAMELTALKLTYTHTVS